MFSGRIDIHCHALFGLDDGAHDLDMSAAILRAEYEDGVRCICLTPHFKPEHMKYHPNELAERTDEAFSVVSEFASGEFPGLSLMLGNELFYHQDCVDNLDSGFCHTLGDSNYVLVEFYPGEQAATIREGMKRIASGGYRPVLAHVERYAALAGNIREVTTLCEFGVVLTSNVAAILGEQGFMVRHNIGRMIKRGLISAVTTDAHRPEGKSPLLGSCGEYIAGKYGDDTADKLTFSVPRAILAGERL